MHEFNDPFPSQECPCGRPQPDTTRLYCDDCIARMGREMAEELAAANDRVEEESNR